MSTTREVLVSVVLAMSPALAQSRPDEAELFGDSSATEAPDGGAADAPVLPSVPQRLSPPSGPASADRDSDQLGGKSSQSKFDTEEVKSDALKVGGTLNLFAQGYWQEGRPFEQGTFGAPFLLDAYIDGRPTDRLRAFVLGRLQYDPTRPAGDASTSTSAAAQSTGSASLIGLTPSTKSNPSVALDQLWLRFDIARAVYFTVGRQKVRWGVSRIWYPTDFLNAQPRDAFNPFDVRLGVNMVKVHVPVESLGWNFYGYGLLDAINVTSSGVTLDRLGGALRAEFVLGPAELGVGGVWQQGRRPRYGLDVSTALGPVDVYAEAALRDARDFVLFHSPSDLTADNLLMRIGSIEAYRPSGVMVQVSGGLSWQFNYTDKNSAILGVEYFYNPAGVSDAVGYQVKTFMPALLGLSLDPIQNAPLYGGRHNLAATLTAPGIPGYDWISLSLSSVVIINDPSGLTRLDLTFRVLSYLNVQLFAAAFYGQSGGQLRFQLSAQEITQLAAFSELAQPGSGATVLDALSSLRWPPVVQAGVLLRLSI